MRTVSQLCNRGLFLEDGRLNYDGTVERAMELYGGSSARSVYRDLSELARPRHRGETMRMQSIHFENTQSLEYTMDSAMEFTLTAVSHIPEPRLRLRLILQNSIAAPIAMTQSEPFEVKADESFTLRVKFPLDGIAPGEYVMKLSLCAGTPIGRAMMYDTLEDVSRFVITDDPAVNSGFIWSERLWGNTRLKPLEVIEH